MRDDLSQEKHGNMTFSVYTYGCYKRGATPLCQKTQKCPNPTKIHLNVIDVLGAPAVLCTFMETFTGVFMHCSTAKKNSKLNT